MTDAPPGGSPRDAANYKNRERGDGSGRAPSQRANDGIQERDLFGEIVRPDPRGILKDRFIMPPFSVLNAREGDWQERKRKWLALGIKSELGRGGEVLPGGGGSAESKSCWNRTGRKPNAIPGGAMLPLERAKSAKASEA